MRKSSPRHFRGTRAGAEIGLPGTDTLGPSLGQLQGSAKSTETGELKLRLTALRLTEDSVRRVAPSDPLGRELAPSPSGVSYQYDGSLKDDGGMGATIASAGICIPA